MPADVDDFVLRQARECRPRDEKLAAVATRQHGVICRRQLLILAFTPNEIQSRRGRTLFPRYGGVYAVGHRRLSARGGWMAAVLASGPRAVLSHEHGLALWGLRPAPAGPIHVTVPGRTRRGRPGIRTHNVRTLPEQDIVLLDGIPVTTIPRALLDVAEKGPSRTLDYALEAAQQRPGFDYEDLLDVIVRSPGRHGIPILARAAEQLAPEPDLTFSEQERLLRSILQEANLPAPRTNVLVEGELVDFAWPEHKLILEFDSWRFHRTRRRFEEDRRRDAKLQAAGYRIIRVTARRLRDDRATFLRELRSLLWPL